MRVKRFLLSLLAILANASIYAHDIAIANTDGVTIYYRYINNNTELAVTYQGTSYSTYPDEYSGNVVIPESVSYNGNTFSVTSIVNYAFRDCTGITSVSIPNSVTTIGNYAFSDCSSLTSVNIPNNITSISSYAFKGCPRLTSVSIPESVTTIGYEAFSDCGLTSITIPNSVTTIGNYAFSGCKGLTSITFPNSVTSIGEKTFSGCSSLMNVNIPESVISIGSSAFMSCTSLTSVTIPESVTSIDDYAFYGCSSLTSITIGNSVTSIGDNAFASTPWFNNQPNGLVYAGKVAYKYKGTMPSNTSITIEGGTTGIASGAFDSCSELTSVIIPESLTSIGPGAFLGCSGLTSVTIPESVTTIGIAAFWGCSRLTSITIPESVTTINASVFNNCSRLTSVTIPESVTSIGDYAFRGCSLLTSINIPSSVISLGDYAFYDCRLTSLKMESKNPALIKYNEYNTFTNKVNTTLYVPAGCKAIYEADNFWKGFKAIVEMEPTVASVVIAPTAKKLTYTGSAQELVTPGEASGGTMQYSLDGTNYSTSIPKGTDAGEYIVYYKVVGDADHSDTEPATVSVTILQSSPAITFADANVKAICVQNWDTDGDGELSETEAAAVTDLGEVFKGNTEISSFDELQYFTGLTEIGSQAFADCTNLTSVSLPTAVIKIQDWAFSNTGFTTFTIPDQIEEVAAHAFYSCKQLTALNIGTGLSTIGWKSFASCPALSQIVVSEDNPKYDSRNESNCIIETETNTLIVGCKNTCIPSTVTRIATVAFEGCWNLTEIALPSSLVEIGELAFSWCINLTSITIPASVTSIGSNAFENCGILTSVVVENVSPITIDENTFSNRANATLYVPAGTKTAYERADNWKEFKEIVEVREIWSGKQIIKDWNSLYIEKEKLSDLKVGDLLHVTVKDVTEGATTENWMVFCDFRDGDWTKMDEWKVLAENTNEVTYLLTGDILHFIKDKGMLFTGSGYTVTQVYATETVYTGSGNSIWVGNQTADAANISIEHLKNANDKSGLRVDDIIRLTFAGEGGDFNLYFLGEDTNWQYQDVGEIVKERTETGADVRVTQGMVDMLSNNLGALIVGVENITLTQVELIQNSWFNIAVNSDMEGTDNVCFLSRENRLENDEIVPSTIVEGAGVDGSRGIVIQSAGNPTNVYDTQFFFRLPQALPAGTKYRISFDYKASQEASCNTEIHADPGTWISSGIGTIDCTTDWKHFELRGTVSAEQSPADNPMRTVAFCLAATPTSSTYYFDNIVFEIDRSQITPLAIVAEAPTAKEITFTGEAQELVNPGRALFGAMQYSLDGTNYSSNIPTGIDVGEYTIYYKVVGDEDHDDTEAATVSVTIEEVMIEETDISLLDNAIFLERTEGLTGGTVKLNIQLKNPDYNPVGCSFRLTLPEGFTLKKDEYGELEYEIGSRARRMSVISTEKSEGIYNFTLTPASGEAVIDGIEGTVLTLTMVVPEDAAVGEHAILLTRNLVQREVEGAVRDAELSDVVAICNVDDYLPGDVNADGKITPSDAIMILYHYFEIAQSGFVMKAADVNQDGNISPADAIQNLLFYFSNDSEAPAKAFWGEMEEKQPE